MSSGKGGGSQTTTQQVSSGPWSAQQPYLKKGFEAAEEFLESDFPTYYPGQTAIDFAPESELALTMARDRAMGGSPLLTQAQNQQALQSGGAYLGGSPFFEGAFSAQVEPMVEQYTQQQMPGLASAFAGAGRLGSNAQQNAMDLQNRNFQRAIADTAGKLAFQNYTNERGLQQQATQNLPGLAAADYADIGQLGNVGAAREAQAQRQLQDDVNRWNFDQFRDANRIAQYMGLVGGGYGTEGTTTQVVPRTGGSSFGQMLGLGLQGLSLLSGNPMAATGIGAATSMGPTSVGSFGGFQGF